MAMAYPVGHLVDDGERRRLADLAPRPDARKVRHGNPGQVHARAS